MASRGRITRRTTPAPRYADEDYVREFAAALNDNYLNCRRYGHTWKPWRVQLIDSEVGRSYEAITRCPSCKSLATEVLSMSGHQIRRHVKYSEGYLASNLGRIAGTGRDVLRLESVTRQFTAAEARAEKRRAS